MCEKQQENREKYAKRSEKGLKIKGFFAADFYGDLVMWVKFDDCRGGEDFSCFVSNYRQLSRITLEMLSK